MSTIAHALVDTYNEPPASLLANHEGCTRYISHTSGKTLTSAQVKHIHSQGKVIVANFEDAATNAKGGAHQGKLDGQFVVSQLHSLGAPENIACYASADYEVHSDALLNTTVAYFKAYTAELHAAGYLSGAYGDYDLIKALLDQNVVDLGWQCAAWSYGKLDPRAVLYQDQYNGSYDVDEIKAPFYGAWTPSGAQEGDAMTPDDRTFVKQVVQNNAQAVIKVLEQVIQNNTSKVIANLPAKADGTFTKADLESALNKAIDGATINTV